jgi:hypothetical protein
MSAPARQRLLTLVLAGLTVLVLALSLPGSAREAWERGGLYVFSSAFFEDLPKRLTGPGRFRFLLQPLTAVALGIGAGRADARSGRPPYLLALALRHDLRGELLGDALRGIVNLLLVGVLLDSVCQWLILGASYPGAALLVGPVLITVPYALARALSNRGATALDRSRSR